MVALPFMIQFLVNFSTSDFIHSAISVASYLDFMIGMLLTFGVVFEEPMLAFVLTKLGILTPDILRKVRRYAIPLIFVIAADHHAAGRRFAVHGRRADDRPVRAEHPHFLRHL